MNSSTGDRKQDAKLYVYHISVEVKFQTSNGGEWSHVDTINVLAADNAQHAIDHAREMLIGSDHTRDYDIKSTCVDVVVHECTRACFVEAIDLKSLHEVGIIELDT